MAENTTITVDRKALYTVLQALVGPGHLIRELQFTRSLHKVGHPNPIEILIEQFQAGGVQVASQGVDALPMQPVVLAADGCVRFRENRIVTMLLERSSEHGREYGYTLNDVAMDAANGRYTADEQMQLAQLIGYSVSGYGDLSYASRESVAKADAAAEALAAQAKQGGAA